MLGYCDGGCDCTGQSRISDRLANGGRAAERRISHRFEGLAVIGRQCNVLLVALAVSTLGVGSIAVAAPKQDAEKGNAGGGGGQGNAQGPPQRDLRIPP